MEWKMGDVVVLREEESGSLVSPYGSFLGVHHLCRTIDAQV
jgi:hypothetical protein